MVSFGNIENTYDDRGYLKNDVIDFSTCGNIMSLNATSSECIMTSLDLMFRYPDPNYRVLKKNIASYEKNSEDLIVLGRSVEDLVTRIARVSDSERFFVVMPADEVYIRGCQVAGKKCEVHLLREERNFISEVDILDDLKEGDTVFFSNPNAITGKLTEKALIVKISEKIGNEGKLILDERFLDMSFDPGNSGKKLFTRCRNTFVIKSTESIFSMHGFSIAYLMGIDTTFLDKVDSISEAFPISVVTDNFLRVAFKEVPYLNRSFNYLLNEKLKLEKALRILGFKVYESDCHIIFFSSYGEGKLESLNFAKELLKLGIIVTDCSNKYGLEEGFYSFAWPDPKKDIFSDFSYSIWNEQHQIKGMIVAKQARWDGQRNVWIFDHVQEQNQINEKEYHIVNKAHSERQLPEKPQDFLVTEHEISHLSLSEMHQNMTKKASPQQREKAWAELLGRISYIFLGIPLLLLGLPILLISYQKWGRDLSIAIPSSVVLAFVAWGLWEALQALAITGYLSPLIAATTIHVLFAGYGIFLLYKQER